MYFNENKESHFVPDRVNGDGLLLAVLLNLQSLIFNLHTICPDTIKIVSKFIAAIQKAQESEVTFDSPGLALQRCLNRNLPLAQVRKLSLFAPDGGNVQSDEWLRSASLLPQLQEQTFEFCGHHPDVPSDLEFPTLRKFCYGDGPDPEWGETRLPYQLICCMPRLQIFTGDVKSSIHGWLKLLEDFG